MMSETIVHNIEHFKTCRLANIWLVCCTVPHIVRWYSISTFTLVLVIFFSHLCNRFFLLYAWFYRIFLYLFVCGCSWPRGSNILHFCIFLGETVMWEYYAEARIIELFGAPSTNIDCVWARRSVVLYEMLAFLYSVLDCHRYVPLLFSSVFHYRFCIISEGVQLLFYLVLHSHTLIVSWVIVPESLVFCAIWRAISVSQSSSSPQHQLSGAFNLSHREIDHHHRLHTLDLVPLWLILLQASCVVGYFVVCLHVEFIEAKAVTICCMFQL